MTALPPVLKILSIPVAVMALISCQPKPDVVNAPKPKTVLYDWYDKGGPGQLVVKISLSEQIARFERNGTVVGWSYVATGVSSYPTPKGDYKILEKKVEKVSNQYGRILDAEGDVVDSDATSSDPLEEGQRFAAAPMPYWMRLTPTGIGMHGGPIPHPGKTASHGCIRMPRKFVPTLYEAVKIGTPVTISQDYTPPATPSRWLATKSKTQ